MCPIPVWRLIYVALDLEKEMEIIHKKKKAYNYMLGKSITHLKIFKPKQPIKKNTHEDTTYYYFDALVITKDHERIPFGKHTIQLPSKTVVYQLWGTLKDIGRIDDDEITVTITRNDNRNFDIVIHDN